MVDVVRFAILIAGGAVFGVGWGFYQGGKFVRKGVQHVSHNHHASKIHKQREEAVEESQRAARLRDALGKGPDACLQSEIDDSLTEINKTRTWNEDALFGRGDQHKNAVVGHLHLSTRRRNGPPRVFVDVYGYDGFRNLIFKVIGAPQHQGHPVVEFAKLSLLVQSVYFVVRVEETEPVEWTDEDRLELVTLQSNLESYEPVSEGLEGDFPAPSSRDPSFPLKNCLGQGRKFFVAGRAERTARLNWAFENLSGKVFEKTDSLVPESLDLAFLPKRSVVFDRPTDAIRFSSPVDLVVVSLDALGRRIPHLSEQPLFQTSHWNPPGLADSVASQIVFFCASGSTATRVDVCVDLSGTSTKDNSFFSFCPRTETVPLFQATCLGRFRHGQADVVAHVRQKGRWDLTCLSHVPCPVPDVDLLRCSPLASKIVPSKVSCLKITVDGCDDLGSKDINGKSDPYVRVYQSEHIAEDGSPVYDSSPLFQTAVVKESLNPRFLNEVHFVRLNDSGASGDEFLLFKVMDRDLMGKDDFEGQATVHLCAENMLPFDGPLVLKHRNPNKFVTGTVTVKIDVCLAPGLANPNDLRRSSSKSSGSSSKSGSRRSTLQPNEAPLDFDVEGLDIGSDSTKLLTSVATRTDSVRRLKPSVLESLLKKFQSSAHREFLVHALLPLDHVPLDVLVGAVGGTDPERFKIAVDVVSQPARVGLPRLFDFEEIKRTLQLFETDDARAEALSLLCHRGLFSLLGGQRQIGEIVALVDPNAPVRLSVVSELAGHYFGWTPALFDAVVSDSSEASRLNVCRILCHHRPSASAAPSDSFRLASFLAFLAPEARFEALRALAEVSDPNDATRRKIPPSLVFESFVALIQTGVVTNVAASFKTLIKSRRDILGDVSPVQLQTCSLEASVVEDLAAFWSASSGSSTPTSSSSTVAMPNEPTVCCICQEDPPTFAFIPCGHKCICSTCERDKLYERLPRKECPICRRKMTSLMRIFD